MITARASRLLIRALPKKLIMGLSEDRASRLLHLLLMTVPCRLRVKENMFEEVMDYRTYCWAIATTYCWAIAISR